MDITCSAEPCPIILNSTCVFYEGDNLIYTGITTNDNLQTALQKIDQKFQDAGLGYIFSNGIEQLTPGGAVMLGGALNKNTTIGGLYNLAFAGTLEASALITTGGTLTDFVKGDGSLDSTSYQPSGDYISDLTGDVIANGPGSVVATLATVFGAPGTYGNSGSVPSITVDAKGRITNVTPTPINYPAQSLSFVGDVDGFGFTGSPVTLTLDTVNIDVYGSNNFLKFAVNGKGLITSATPVNGGDITTVLGYVPVNDAIELSINGVAHDLTSNRSWSVGTVTSVGVTAGLGISASVSNPNTIPVINIVNTAPDQTVILNAGYGISVTGSYPNFTITNDYPDLPEKVTSFSSGNLVPLFTTSVATPTTTPALSFALANAAANTVFAGPDGGAGTPTYRALVAADIPSLQYISSISVSAPLATTGGLTPTLSISQAGSITDGYLSSTDWNTFDNKTTCTGTVTSVDLCSTTSGVSISGGPITSSGSINLDIATASASCDGLLTSTDWSTFNSKEDALGYIPVPDTRQLGINGVNYDLTADRCWSVGTVTSITASAPLTGGTITGSGSVGITQASGGTDGYLSSTDWNTFNGKQPAGNYITDLTGDATASGPGSAGLTLATVNAATGTFGSSTQVPVITVNNKGLVTCVTTDTISGSLEFIGDVTGVGSTGTCTSLTLATVNNDVYTSETLLNIAVNGKGLITSANPTTSGNICSTLGYTPEDVANKSTCTSLGSSNTLYPTQLAVKTYIDNATAGGIVLQGDWNAATNTPDITGTTTTGFAWRVSVDGTTNLGGITSWHVGDLAVKSATGWVKIDNSDGVTSVFGRFGAVVATTGDYLSCQVTECGNLYYTDARVRAAVGHTAPLTYCSTTGVFGISQSNATTDGYLSATDWTTFNDKQPLIAAGTIGQYYRGDKTFQTLDTSVVTEGTNLYFTNTRARAAICASSGVAYNPTTGLITNSCPDQIVSLTGGGTTSITGTYPNFTITSADSCLGTVTSVAVSGTNIGVTGSPITSSGTIGLSLSAANVCSALGFSPYNSTNPAGYTTCTGTVTSVATSTSTTGVLLSGSPISTSGTLGINISTASATCTGLLTSADWNTFNSKTSCLGTVTSVAASTSTTGVLLSGSPITSSGTLGVNISTASTVCTGLLTAADWNTFNNKTSCTGTVSSVGLTSSTTGVSIGGSPITSSGNLSLNITTASSLCTGLLTAADWNSFNSRTSCTGTVTSVNATGTNISVTGGPITSSGTLAISLSGANVCSALGYTPYNATNPNGYTTCIGTVTSAGIVATNINVCNSPVTTSGNICLNLTGANVCSALGYSPVQPNGTGATGTWGISITGNAATSTVTTFVCSPDGGRNPNTAPLPNTNPLSVSYNFAGAGFITGATGNYAGVMTYTPWDGTSASTGDSSYQLAFINETGVNASGIPGLSLRNGINSSWNATWYKFWHTGNFTPGAYLPLSGGTMTGTLNVAGFGTNGFVNGTGDGASFATYNFALSGWNSMAFYNPTGGGAYPNQVSGLIDFRFGTINMKGGFSVNGSTVLYAGNYNSYAPTLTGGGASGTWAINVTGTAGSASTASQVTINYNNDSNANYQMLWGSGNSVYGTGDVFVNPSSDVISARGGYISFSNPWGTSNSAFFPNGISTAGGQNWIYGNTYIGNAPSNGSGAEIFSNGRIYIRSANTSGTWGYAGQFVDRNNAANNYAPWSFESEYGNHSWGLVARFHIQQSGADKPSLQFSAIGSNERWSIGYVTGSDYNFRITQNHAYRPDGSGISDGWGTERFRIDGSGNTYAAIGGTLYANGTQVVTNNGGTWNIAIVGNAGTVGGFSAGVFFRDLGFEGGGSNADTIAASRSAFTYAAAAPHSGPLTHFGAGGYGLQLNATYHSGDQNISYRVRNGDAGAWKSWFSFITSANIGSQSVNYANSAGSAPNGSNINNYYNSTAGEGFGFRFWNGDEQYKLSMGVGGQYQYGPVNDYSIKLHMGSGTGRGITMGITGVTPTFAHNTTSGNTQVAGTMGASVFYDNQDPTYYVDPNGTSNLLKLSGRTMAYNDMNPMSANSPYAARYNASAIYRNGSMGFGTVDLNVILSNWGSGFIDTWSNPGNAPGGSSHYVGFQSLHGNFENNSQAYGFQMACAGEADNRFFWRSAWPNVRSWVEMIHSGNIGSQSVSYANSAGSASSAARAFYSIDGFVNTGGHGSSYIQNELPAASNGAATGRVVLRQWCSEPGVTWDWAGFGYNVTNDGGSPDGFGRFNGNFGQAYMRFSSNGDWYFYNTTTGGTRTTSMSFSSTGAANFGSTINNGSVWINNGANSNSYNENIRLFNAPNGVSVIAFSASGTSGTPTTSILGYPDRMEFRYNDGAQFRIYNGYAEAMGSLRAPIFYDSNDTGYYLDPNGSSVLNTVYIAGTLRNNGSVSDDDAFGLYFDSGGSTAYAIYREPGGWGFPYPDLRIAFHTGIKFGANANYKGMNFYTDYDMSGLVMSVNNGDYNTGGIYVHGTAYASAYYEVSDARTKTILEDNSRVKGIELIKPKLYQKNGKTEFGYIAQDFLDIMPYAVNNDNVDGMYSLVYREVHTAKIAMVEDEVDVLKRRVSELEVKLQKYEA